MRRRFTKALPFGLSLLVSFVVIISFGETLDIALAADDPAATKSSQTNPLEIPGSFKDLADGKDRVTAKSYTDHGGGAASPQTTPIQLEIDADKVMGTRAATPALADSEGLDFHATAYCLKGRTASGTFVKPGMIAADPRVLPLGTVVHLRAGPYTGIYTVTDTGGSIKGRRVDVYVPTYREARQFGRRQIKLKVIGRKSAKGNQSTKTLEAVAR